MKKRNTAQRRRFVARVPDRREYANFSVQEDGRLHTCRPLTSLETLSYDLDMTLPETPMGITLPSVECRDDSVIELVCPVCLHAWFLSDSFYRYLVQTQRNVNVLTPGLFTWRFEAPCCVPCNAPVRAISLTADIPNFLD